MTTPLIVSNIVPVLSGMLKNLQVLCPELNFVYTESVSYEDGIRRFRMNNQDKTITNTYPLFIFRRTNLSHSTEALGRRAAGTQLCAANGEVFDLVHGQFDVEFLFVHKFVRKVEEFEIQYLSNEIQRVARDVVTKIPGFDDTFTHNATFGDLTNVTVQDEDNYYKGVSGNITLRGFYFLGRGTTPLIEQINYEIANQTTQLTYCSGVIP